MRLIDADGLKYQLLKPNTNPTLWCVSKDAVDLMPTVDAVPVVRCEKCFYGKPYNEVWYHPKKNSMWCKRNETEHEYGWFCADGMEKVSE